jgi:amidohydrolase
VPRPVGSWAREARRLLPALRTWRSSLHREPELSNEEVKTQAKIVEWLRELGLAPTTYPGFHGVSAVLGEGRSGPCVAVRADMDGLPVQEGRSVPFRSIVPGTMHACGHDVHMACALGAAALFQRHADALRGPVKFLFQPAEEQGERGGALPFIERGCLTNPKVDFVLGQHVEPSLPAGAIGWKKGPLMAAADHFIITVRGTGGHAAFPHRGADAVVASAEVIVGLQALVSRRRDPLDPVVVSVGMVHGGTRHNVLPGEVVLEGTVRTFRPETRDALERMVKERSRLLARSLGASATVEYRRGYPVTVNTPAATEIVVQALAEEFGDRALHELERPIMGAEDFSRYLERVPGTFLFLGAGIAGLPATLHSPTFEPPESILVTGTAALAAATEGLQRSG